MRGIPRPDFGRPTIPTDKATLGLPWGGASEPEKKVVLHVKILSTDAAERLEIARFVEAQLKDQRVGSSGLKLMITADEPVEVSLAPLSPIVAELVAEVKKALGIR